MKDLIDAVGRYIQRNRFRVFFAGVGFVCMVLILVIGFWKTLFIFSGTVIAGMIGARKDKGHVFRAVLKRFMVSKYR